MESSLHLFNFRPATLDKDAHAKNNPTSDVLLLGASGFLGASLIDAFLPGRIMATHCSHPSSGTFHFDVRTTAVQKLIGQLPSLPESAVIMLGNTKIDDCARDSVGTAQINVQGIIRIIEELQFLGIKPVFVSSDSVFDGSHPYWQESDAVCPILEYGRQKAAVESYIASMKPPWLIVRPPKLLSTRVDRRCLLNEWIRTLGSEGTITCAIDQFFTPAAVEDVAASIALLVRSKAQGIYHLGGVNRLSRRDLLGLVIKEFSKQAEVRAKVVVCYLKDIPVLEIRPLDASLNSEKFRLEYGVRYKHPAEIVCSAVGAYFVDSASLMTRR
jgi:dTDP-4-dehydrorhamnose reductase